MRKTKPLIFSAHAQTDHLRPDIGGVKWDARNDPAESEASLLEGCAKGSDSACHDATSDDHIVNAEIDLVHRYEAQSANLHLCRRSFR